MTEAKISTLLVTGATSGIGQATARRFDADGRKMVLVGRRKDRLEALAGELTAAVHPLALDVTDRDAVAEAIAALPEGFSDIDVLLNNAGLALGLGGAQDGEIDEWEQMIDTNIKGLTYVTRAVLPGMIARDSGHVINIGSVAGSYPFPGATVYGATKAFVHQFSLNLRADLLGTRVRVTCVEPGLTDTEFAVVRFKGDTKRAAEFYAGTNAMTGDDIAGVIHAVSTLPAHVNINKIEVMPVSQAFSPFAIHRD